MSRLQRAIEHRVARFLCNLPRPVRGFLAGRPHRHEGLHLDQQLQILLRIRTLRGSKPFSHYTPKQARELYRHESAVGSGKPVSVGAVRDLSVDGAAGPLRARLYTPVGAGPHPLLVYYHGGGFVIGDLDTHDAPCRLLCQEGRVQVLAVDYRLAPEHPFPAAPDDCLAALQWARKNAASIGADPKRIGVGGDSAGGNLAAVVALQCKLTGKEAPAFQLLIYPTTDSTREWNSYATFGEGFILCDEERKWFMHHYLQNPQSDLYDLKATPMLADDLSGLAPALVVTADFDMLRDEGEAYYEALLQAGTPAKRLRASGVGHGFIHTIGVNKASRDATIEIAKMTGDALRGEGGLQVADLK